MAKVVRRFLHEFILVLEEDDVGARCSKNSASSSEPSTKIESAAHRRFEVAKPDLLDHGRPRNLFCNFREPEPIRLLLYILHVFEARQRRPAGSIANSLENGFGLPSTVRLTRPVCIPPGRHMHCRRSPVRPPHRASTSAATKRAGTPDGHRSLPDEGGHRTPSAGRTACIRPDWRPPGNDRIGPNTPIVGKAKPLRNEAPIEGWGNLTHQSVLIPRVAEPVHGGYTG